MQQSGSWEGLGAERLFQMHVKKFGNSHQKTNSADLKPSPTEIYRNIKFG